VQAAAYWMPAFAGMTLRAWLAQPFLIVFATNSRMLRSVSSDDQI
jgi:hypothetical protein